MSDEVSRTFSGHTLFTQKVCCGTSRFGEYAHEGIRAGYRKLAQLLRMALGAPSHTQKCVRLYGVYANRNHQPFQVFVEVAEQTSS